MNEVSELNATELLKAELADFVKNVKIGTLLEKIERRSQLSLYQKINIVFGKPSKTIPRYVLIYVVQKLFSLFQFPQDNYSLWLRLQSYIADNALTICFAGFTIVNIFSYNSEYVHQQKKLDWSQYHALGVNDFKKLDGVLATLVSQKKVLLEQINSLVDNGELDFEPIQRDALQFFLQLNERRSQFKKTNLKVFFKKYFDKYNHRDFSTEENYRVFLECHLQSLKNILKLVLGDSQILDKLGRRLHGEVLLSSQLTIRPSVG